MRKRSLSGLASALIAVMLMAAAARADSVSVVTTLSGLSANDTILWSQLGADATELTASSSFSSSNGLTGSAVLTGPNSLIAVVCPETLCSWNPLSSTGFNAGDSLIWTADAGSSGNGPLTVNFASKSVTAAGGFIQADGPGQFTAQIEAFNGATSLGTFPVASDTSGDATFIGVIDNSAANITSVQFSITSCNGDCSDFGIDTVSLDAPSGGPTATPTMTGGPTPTATPTPTPTPTPGAGTLSFRPTFVAFGSKTKVGKSKTEKVTIKNTSTKSSKISVTINGEMASPTPPFAVTSQCAKTLAPGKSCKVSVKFTPTDTTPLTGTLTVMDTAQGSPQTVPLSGTGK
jgi:hypothetical protein